MKYINGDLFTSKHSLAHCVSGDFAMGAGIALEFRRRYPEILIAARKQWQIIIGSCLAVPVRDRVIFNLITKERYWHKPTYKTLENALIHMFVQAHDCGIRVISMPKIGSGLDKLDWREVEKLILRHHGDIEVEIYYIGGGNV